MMIMSTKLMSAPKVLLFSLVLFSTGGCQTFATKGVVDSDKSAYRHTNDDVSDKKSDLMQLYIYKSSSYENTAERDGYFVMFSPAPKKPDTAQEKNSPVIFFED